MMKARILISFNNALMAAREEVFLCAVVEKRKISYFGLALNLFQHLISPNQDNLSYSAQTFISG